MTAPVASASWRSCRFSRVIRWMTAAASSSCPRSSRFSWRSRGSACAMRALITFSGVHRAPRYPHSFLATSGPVMRRSNELTALEHEPEAIPAQFTASLIAAGVQALAVEPDLAIVGDQDAGQAMQQGGLP